MDLLNIMVQLVNAGLQVYLATIFYSSFSKTKYSLKIILPTEIICILFMAFGLVFFRGKVIVYLFTLLPTLLLTFLFVSSVISKIVSFLQYNAVSIIAEMIIAALVSITMHINFADISGAVYIIGMLMSKLFVFIIVAIIKISKRGRFTYYYKSGNIKACMFPFASLLVMIIQYIILREDRSQNSNFSYLLLASYTVLIISNMIVFDYIDSICMHASDKEKIAVANEIITQQTIQYNDLIKHNEDIIKIQHDSKHFYMGLISEIEAGRYSEALSQLKDLYANSDFISMKSNNIIHSVVEMMKQKAAKYNTVIDFSYTELNSIKILPTDLAIILGNALDNAIEACGKIDNGSEKTIQLFIRPQNETIIITVKNPVVENIDVSNLASTKPNSERHGYGIISMKKIAAKYDGEIAFTCTNNLFAVSAVLNNIPINND